MPHQSISNPRLESEKEVFSSATCGFLGVSEEGHAIGTLFECPNNSNCVPIAVGIYF